MAARALGAATRGLWRCTEPVFTPPGLRARSSSINQALLRPRVLQQQESISGSAEPPGKGLGPWGAQQRTGV